MVANKAVRIQTRSGLTIIWACLLAVVAIYAAVCLMIIPPAAQTNNHSETLRYAFTGAGIFFGALSAWWRRRFLADDGSVPLTAEHLQTHSILVWLLSDAVAICGFVFAVISHTVSEYFPFGLAAGGLLLLHRPAALPFDRVRQTVV